MKFSDSNLRVRLTFGALLAGLYLGSFASAANVAEGANEKILSDVTTEVTIELTPATVRCSSLGYGRQELKVSVPDLQFLTVFNHTNIGETLPCMTAGVCRSGNMPGDLITSDQTAEMANIRVQLVEVFSVDAAQNTCVRFLEERVSTEIRGKDFHHVRSAYLGEHPITQCPQR